MNKLALFSTSLCTLMVCLLTVDGIKILSGHACHLPEQHKELLLTGFLIWFIIVLAGQKSNDDDWAELV